MLPLNKKITSLMNYFGNTYKFTTNNDIVKHNHPLYNHLRPPWNGNGTASISIKNWLPPQHPPKPYKSEPGEYHDLGTISICLTTESRWNYIWCHNLSHSPSP